jgi:hypothetical protein
MPKVNPEECLQRYQAIVKIDREEDGEELRKCG